MLNKDTVTQTKPAADGGTLRLKKRIKHRTELYVINLNVKGKTKPERRVRSKRIAYVDEYWAH